MDEVKEAFKRVKEDIFFLGNEITRLDNLIQEIRIESRNIQNSIEKFKLEILESNEKLLIELKNISQKQEKSPTDIKEMSTDTFITPTDNMLLEALKAEIKGFSIGNGGVPTDRQTHQQTDRHINNEEFQQKNEENEVPNIIKKEQNVVVNEKGDDFDRAIKILNSLDSVKKEIRFKFKKLTDQEFNVFSNLYTLEEKGILVDYKVLAENLALSESSIRDYVGKLIIKGIPILKEKINNKQIILKISKDLKEITPLDAIIRLRGI